MTNSERLYPELQCFVLMPFGSRDEYQKGEDEANFVYQKIIKPAIEKSLKIKSDNKNIVREVDKRESGSINRSIIQKIDEAPLVIADITGQNPNVFLEIGMRYTLKRHGTILIRQPDVDIPFDLKNYRHHTYNVFDEYAADKLSKAINSTLENGNTNSDSPVYEVFPSLNVRTNPTNLMRMPWREYTERIDRIRVHINSAINQQTYRPDAIIGITKGGASFADLLTQKMGGYKGPVLSLWAERDKEADWFRNTINLQMIQGLKDHLNKDIKDLSILIVDEVIASGTTYKQAINLVKEHCKNCDLRFLPMVYRADKNFEEVADTILWRHNAFDFTDDQINEIHLVDWVELPWTKDIRRK